MASTYKTPGVYVEEISLFPPSVAQVETAVPAFIGYTEKAFKNGESLLKKPTRINSLSEYEAWFGVGPNVTYNVYLDTNDAVMQVIPSSTFYMYESLRLFYENGGGKCYIISVGDYGGTAQIAELTGGLGPLEKEDEPTLIVCPDAALTDGSLYDFQQAALLQCARLGDRFVIMDLLKSDENTPNQSVVDRVGQFRNKIGINNLKYGAAYVPYVFSSLPKTIRYRNVSLFRGAPPGTALSLEALTSDNNAIQLIFDLANAKKASDTLKSYIAVGAPGILTGTSKSFEEEFKKLFDAYATALAADKRARLRDIYNFVQKILVTLNTFQGTLPTKVGATPNPASKTNSVSFVLKDDITGVIASSGIKNVMETLIKHSNASKADDALDEVFTPSADLTTAITFVGANAAATDAGLVAQYAAFPQAELKYDEAKKAVSAAFTSFINFFYTIQAAAANYERTLDTSLANSFGVYKDILAKISTSTSQLPPSGAVAGVYAMVDDQRGVWKAPANVSLNSVVGPVVPIDNVQQDEFNVDTNAGKSVNAIRAFTGKGTLIWGARTLAGNDNEWRYISVRRFFNMVEESVKKATGQFVFEPNDANTWVKVKGMIENFLTVLWRQGALAGAKADQAFFVKVGLGQTMTAQDILEGKMNVEIGMAVVRPAEFIILKFSHKMQES
ncbi:phage tail protein [Paraflavitalea soli]|uniref:Phage tail protein n=1 Tax=Paraflavitalea soli TaxID=2315862 RepID=A0A3B7MHB3_9BACT|nr:phage tail sheath C-terminal domain-containing protein [Paraflavitalea soli]AXY73782.1 phage tail protein [Paraflavitalea soli]